MLIRKTVICLLLLGLVCSSIGKYRLLSYTTETSPRMVLSLSTLLTNEVSRGICYAQDNSQEINSKQIQQKLDEILKNQKTILDELEKVKAEVQKIKMRI